MELTEAQREQLVRLGLLKGTDAAAAETANAVIVSEVRRHGARPVTHEGRSASVVRKPVQGKKSPNTALVREASVLMDTLGPLPCWGTVVDFKADGGFGFVSVPDRSKELFFHFTGRRPLVRGQAGNVQPGDVLLYMPGADPRKPGRRCVLRWLRATELSAADLPPPADQAALDVMRHDVLMRAPLDQLQGLLVADWYARLWRGTGEAPCDLDDSVLASVWMQRLAALDVTSLAKAVKQHPTSIRYTVGALLHPEAKGFPLKLALEHFHSTQLAVLGAPDAAWVSEANRATLMAWQLHAVARGIPARGVWDQWFAGNTAMEATLAAQEAAHGSLTSEWAQAWLQRLIGNQVLSPKQAESLERAGACSAISVFASLPTSRQQKLLVQWSRQPGQLDQLVHGQRRALIGVVAKLSLGVDLETDGERIWELGCACGEDAEQLFSDGSGGRLADALQVLTARIGEAMLVIGHNILAWDWPILQRHLQLDRPPLIWDTLLVQYLLEPGAHSHALGGAHHAGDDALATVELFAQQLQRLPPSFLSQLLQGAFHDACQLLEGVSAAWDEATPLARPLPSEWWPEDDTAGAAILLPKHRLRDVDWMPGVVVVQANPEERLPESLWQIDGERLEQELAEAKFASPAALALLAVTRRARVQGIALRRNMIPLWLTDGAPELAAAVDHASAIPAAGTGRCVSPLPASAAWWAQADLARYKVVRDGHGALIVGYGRMAATDAGRLAGGLPSGDLVCVQQEFGSLWLRIDRAAGMLDLRGGWSAFRSLPVAAARMLTLSAEERAATLPLLAIRRERVLYPGTLDQSMYWIEVLRTFREVGRVTQEGVPILLTGSSNHPKLLDLLATGLAEIAVGEVRPVHRSRREHLRRAAHRGLMLVDDVDQWPVWQALAESSGVALVPVVESLPLEEWYAAAQPVGLSTEDGTTAGTITATPAAAATSAPHAVSVAVLLAALPGLVATFLAEWLHASGLMGVEQSVWIIDPRAGSAASDLRGLMEERAVDGAVCLPAERGRLDGVLRPLRVERQPAPTDIAAMERFLVDHWQPSGGRGGDVVQGFKASQKPVMEAICARQSDVLVPLPTGEGKSVLFQVPALCRGLRNRRLTLVISPLKALMKDQVERLREQGFAESADYLSSDLTPYEVEEVMQGVLGHRIVLLYVAPERLRSPAFVDVLSRRIESDVGLEHVVVDEAHCVNQWGYEFRPDYFHAVDYLLRTLRGEARLEPTPFLLLSATVTASDRDRLAKLLATPSSGQQGRELLVRPDAFTNPLRAHIAVLPQRVHGLINDKRGFAQAVEERLPAILEAAGAARRNKLQTGQRSAVIVFVAWRMQAEDLATLLAARVGDGVDYYHAGLDAETREEIYTRFREGELDVLVATKAFGMGMDIPDIHWVIHLGPPAYLEDYLQEVGRIGRGVMERQRAELDRLSARLLFSNADFEGNRAMRAQGSLQLPMIEQVRRQIAEHAEEFEGTQIAFVPQYGYEPYKSEGEKRANATRLRMSLYWLERAGAVELHGVTADLLTVDLDLRRLRLVAAEQSPLGAVARTILQLDGLKESHASGGATGSGASSASDGWLSRILDGLSSALGFLFGATAATKLGSSGTSQPPADNAGDGRCTAIINLSQIRVRCKIKTLSEVMVCLAELEKRGGLSLRWTLDFAGRSMAPEPPLRIRALFAAVGGAVDALIDRLSRKGRIEFDPHDLLDATWNLDAGGRLPDAEVQRLRKRYQRAWLHGFRSLARASGVRLRQLVGKAGTVVWEAELASSKKVSVRQRKDYLLKSAQSLFKLFKRNLDLKQDAVSVAELIRAMQAEDPMGRFRRLDLKPVLGVLAAMGLVSARAETLPLSHVVVLRASASSLESRVDLRGELKQVNDLAEVRVRAMEVFANLPDEARDRFIEGYFAQSDAEGLRAFLDAQLGEIDDAGDAELSGFIREKREQLRATKVVDFFKFYEASEEPNQWKAMQHPFNRHLLVNAGPGAGKTAVLVGRIAHLIREQHIKPSEIMVLAFNRAVVFEIKRRVRELFTALGYGSYVRSVRVSTFHSLAMRSLADAGEQGFRGRTESLLADFARRLSSDARFREQVAGTCRCILVDEFQDVTEDVYAIICNLHLGSGSHAGVMAIGDDDQDILRWQRVKNKEKDEFAEEFFNRFRRDFAVNDADYVELGVNFRSSKGIVERSQEMVAYCLNGNGQSSRLKVGRLRACSRANDRSEDGLNGFDRLDWRGRPWIDAVGHAVGMCQQMRDGSAGSVAILCRGNADVAEAHHRLIRVMPNLVVQGKASVRVADLRHVALWVELLDQAAADRDTALTDTLKSELLAAFWRGTDIPEARATASSPVDIGSLWDLCCQEHAFPRLSSLTRFIRELQSDELERLLGTRRDRPQAVVSTIHKVKGLEFDNVIVLPSRQKFASADSELAVMERGAAEEARLLYVAMTRAKRRLVYFMGDREYAWAKAPRRPYEGSEGTSLVLNGSPEEVWLGWAIEKSFSNRDPNRLQDYIEKEVQVGDPVVLGGCGQGERMPLMHRRPAGGLRQVGFLASASGAGTKDAALAVSAVIRFRVDGQDPWRVPQAILKRSWGYVVLVSGRLR